MTDDGFAGELPAGRRTRPNSDRAVGERSAALSAGDVLALCDRHLDEVGRRNHLFGWLRPPGGGADAWLPVDAYYPRNRLVVLYRARARTHDQVYRELVPQHGLRLLVLSPDELGTTAAGARRALAAMLARLEPSPAPARQAAAEHEDVWKKVSARAAGAASSRSRPAAATSSARKTKTETESRPARATGQNGATDGVPQPSARERAERFLATEAARRGRREPAPTSADSPLVGVAVGLGLFLVLLVAVIYIASSGG